MPFKNMTKNLQQAKRRKRKERIKTIERKLKWLYFYARKFWLFIVLYTLLGLAGIAVSLFGAFVSRDMIDIITGHKVGELIRTFAMMIGAQLGNLAVSQISMYFLTYINAKVENSLKAHMYEQIMTSEWEVLDRYSSGYISARWGGDTSLISNGLLTLVPNVVLHIVRLLSSLIIVLKNDPMFALIALVSIPLNLFVTGKNGKRLKKANEASMNNSGNMSLFISESFVNIQLIKAFDMISSYKNKLNKVQNENLSVRMKYQKATATNSLILMIVSIIVTYSTMGFGIFRVWNGYLTYGSMTMLIGLANSLSASIQGFMGIVPSAINLSNAVGRMMVFENLPKEDFSHFDDVKKFYEEHHSEGVGLSVSDASFSYANGTEVFDNVSFEAHPGSIVALIGPSGQGKTTMLRLLLAIINPKCGNAYLTYGDNTYNDSAEKLPISASIRQLIAYVPQGNTMFAGTIAENMRNVREDATDEEIIEALKMACAWDFVEKLPDGINSEIKERGGGFSEGQAQRLSIARAIVRRSPILMLDEATSALDIATEKQLLENIISDSTLKTVILTTHRPEVMEVCDYIYTINDCKLELMHEENKQ